MPLDNIESSKDFVKKIIKRDRKIFFKDYEESICSFDLDCEHNNENKLNKNDNNKSLENINNYSKNIESSKKPLIADFTEYNPFHKGHYHCMKVAKEKVPNSLFVSVVPGLFERSGRGIPFIMTREARAETAIASGADIVVEGPPMGILGSGQYSLCLAKMFQALETDFIPRGYKPFAEFDTILERISKGHGVFPKPYKIIDIDEGDVLYKGKLEEDNYVIVSLSKSLKKINFNFKDKFIFVKRIEGVSGTLIREATNTGDFTKVKDMLLPQTIAILEKEIKEGRAPLNLSRDEDTILDSANNLSYDELIELNLMNEKIVNELINTREIKEFESIDEIENFIPYGFSSHIKHRVLSVLETKIKKGIIYDYIDNYPPNIRVLNYKNESVLEEFKEKLNNDNRRIELWQ